MSNVKVTIPKPDKVLFTMIRDGLRREKRRLIEMVLSLLLLSISQGVFLVLVGPFFRVMFQGGKNQILIKDLVPGQWGHWFPALGDVLVERPLIIILVPVLMVLAGALKGVATYQFQLGQQAIALVIAKDYRDRLFECLLLQPFQKIVQRSPGRWVSIILNDVMQLQNRFSDFMSSFIKDGVLVLSCLVFLAFLHWPTALFLILVGPILGFGMGRIGKTISRYAESWQRELARMSAAILDLRERFWFIRAQKAEEIEGKRFGALNQEYYDAIRQSILIRSIFAPGLEWVGFCFFSLALIMMGRKSGPDVFEPASFIQFFAALGLVLRPLKNLGEQFSRYQETRGSLLESLKLFQELQDPERLALARVSASENLSQMPHVDISALEAGYAGLSAIRLDHIELRPGKTIAIIGPSGAGKSTLLKVFSGLLEPSRWQADCPWDQVCGWSNLVSQAPFLFQDSLRRNLLYGNQNAATLGDSAIWAALEMVNIAEETRALSQGLDTPVQAIVSNFSGGQIQRFVIARALLRSQPLILLDEATSAIDAKSEYDITRRSIVLTREKSLCLIAVTHRLSWLHEYDEIWFMEGGAIRFKGLHRDLMKHERYQAYISAHHFD